MSGSTGIQTAVNVVQVPAFEGDFCDSNPRYSVDAGPFGLVAGVNGLTIGRFAWWDNTLVDANNAPLRANNFGFGPPQGLVHREQQGLNLVYLSDAAMTIPAGFPITLMSGAGLWVRNAGAGAALVGQKAYANLQTGQVSFAATGSPATGASVTASIAASTFSVTGSIAGLGGDVLTVTAVSSGTIVPGATISGTGIATGTQIVNQLSGTVGGIGTYAVSIPEQTVASTTVSGTYGTMTVTAVGSGALAVGDSLTGSGVVAGTFLTAFGTGTGGTGTYIVNNNTVVASTTITAASNVETSFIARSEGLTGELIKISNQLMP